MSEILSALISRPPLRIFLPDSIDRGMALFNNKGTPVDQMVQRTKQLRLNDGQECQAVLKSLVNSGISGISCGHDWQQLTALLSFAADVQTPGVMSQAVLSIGHGGSLEFPSLRLPAYAAVGLQFLKNLRVHFTGLPTLRIFSGQQSGMKCNALPADVVWKITTVNFALIHLFAKAFYPEISSNVMFDFDTPFDELGSVPADLVACLRRSNGSYSGLQETLNQLADMGSKRGEDGRKRAVDYAATHPLGFADFRIAGPAAATRWLRHCADLQSRVMISIGGPPERYFNVCRIFLSEQSEKLFRNVLRPKAAVPLITSVGRVPVYNPRSYEPRFKTSDLQDQTFAVLSDPLIGPDFEDLFAKVGGREVYVTWAREVSEVLELAAELSSEYGHEFVAASVLSGQDSMDALSSLEALSSSAVADFCHQHRRGVV